jgi:LEA14-like dessication related protein
VWKNYFLWKTSDFGTFRPLNRPKLGTTRGTLVPLAIAGGGIFAVFMIGKIHALKSLSFKLRNVRFDLSSSDPLLFLDIGIVNPTGKTITVKQISGTISVDQQNIATVFQNSVVTVQPFNETPYTVPFQIQVESAVSEVIRLLSPGTMAETVVRFVGSVNLEGILFPVNVSYKLV